MPIYEYRCQRCGAKFSRLVRAPCGAATPACRHCGDENVTRLISRVAVPSRRQPAGSFKDVGLWARKQLQQRGIKAGAQFEEIVEKGRTGKFLKEP